MSNGTVTSRIDWSATIYRQRSVFFRAAALCLGALLLLYAVLALFFSASADWYPAASDAILLTTNILATLALGYAAWNARQASGSKQMMALAWGVMAAAQMMYVLGDSVVVLLQNFGPGTGGELPFPSIADFFYLAYYPLFAAGLLILLPSLTAAVRLKRLERQKIALEIAIVMLAAFLLLLNFLIVPIAQNTDATLGQLLVSTAYPIFDLALFFILLHVMYRQVHISRAQMDQSPIQIPALLFLQAGLVLTLFTDSGYTWLSLEGTYASGSLIDLFYAISYCLVAMAGLLQAEPVLPAGAPASTAPASRFNWLNYMPYLAGLLAFLLLAFYERLAALPLAVLTGGVGAILVLVMLRQLISMRENAELYRDEQRRRQLAESLTRAAGEITSTLDHQQTPGRILDQLALVVPYERCSIFLQRDRFLQMVAQRGFPQDDHHLQAVEITLRQADPYYTLVETGQPLIIPDVTQEPGWTILPWLTLNHSWMGVPLTVQERCIGMISLTRRETDAFGPDDIQPAMAFAGQAAVALQNAQLYRELNDAYCTLEVLDRAKASFIEVAAHELRTPLTVMKGYSQLLAEEEALMADPQYAQMLSGMINGADHMQEVVNKMLDMTRIDVQVLKLHKGLFQPNELFQRLSAQYEKALLERRLTLTFDIQRGLPPMMADSDLLLKAFTQLLVNAIKYTPDGGRITVSACLDGDMLEVVIADTGIGIDAEQLEVIFEKFYQTGQVSLHSSGQVKFKGGGPGLGLPIARGIITAHGGKIWAESPGHDEKTFPGSRFIVRLPL